MTSCAWFSQVEVDKFSLGVCRAAAWVYDTFRFLFFPREWVNGVKCDCGERYTLVHLLPIIVQHLSCGLTKQWSKMKRWLCIRDEELSWNCAATWSLVASGLKGKEQSSFASRARRPLTNVRWMRNFVVRIRNLSVDSIMR